MIAGFRSRKLAVLGLVGAVLALVGAACSSGVAQKDYDAVKSQLADKERQVAALQQQLTALQGQASAKNDELAAVQRQLASAQQAAAAAKGAIIGAISATPARPPTPTPGPSPTPRPVPPPKTMPIAFYVDTATASTSSFNVAPTTSCVRTSLFKRGMKLLWRMEMVDASTGKVLQGSDVDQAVLKLPNGEEKRFAYRPHGSVEPVPFFWTTSWDVPMDFPLGFMDYSIEVTTRDGKKGAFKEIAVRSPTGVSGALTIVE